MNELKIEYIALAELTPYEKNARLHTEVDLKTIENSIDAFGMCDPIGIWGERNIIVEGHGRMLALKALGHEKAPCIRLDHLTDEQRRAYALAHNKTAEMSRWDFELLESELEELDFNMEDFGFDLATVDEQFDESNLDDIVDKTSVIISINCKSYECYQQICERIENLADEVGASVAVKMA